MDRGRGGEADWLEVNDGEGDGVEGVVPVPVVAEGIRVTGEGISVCGDAVIVLCIVGGEVAEAGGGIDPVGLTGCVVPWVEVDVGSNVS